MNRTEWPILSHSDPIQFSQVPPNYIPYSAKWIFSTNYYKKGIYFDSKYYALSKEQNFFGPMYFVPIFANLS